MNTDVSHAESFSGGSINIPEGYKVLTIENFNEREGKKGSPTRGYNIWFTNEVSVDVTAIYNVKLKKYDFSHFGIPVEEKENEETIQKAK